MALVRVILEGFRQHSPLKTGDRFDFPAMSSWLLTSAGAWPDPRYATANPVAMSVLVSRPWVVHGRRRSLLRA